MIAHADTIIDPGAVMVVALHTAIADRAMPAATCTDSLAVGTKLCTVYVVEHLHEVDVSIF